MSGTKIAGEEKRRALNGCRFGHDPGRANKAKRR